MTHTVNSWNLSSYITEITYIAQREVTSVVYMLAVFGDDMITLSTQKVM